MARRIFFNMVVIITIKKINYHHTASHSHKFIKEHFCFFCSIYAIAILISQVCEYIYISHSQNFLYLLKLINILIQISQSVDS